MRNYSMIYIDDNPGGIDISSALDHVSIQRKAHVLRYRTDQDRRLSLSAYMLLQRALLEVYGIDDSPLFGYSASGKPYLKDYPDIHFSLSHCHDAVACVIGSEPVGIDVESLSSYSPDLIDVCMNADERLEILESDDASVAFIGLWTRKESFLKLTGCGLSDDMKDVLLQASGYRFETY